MKSSWISSDDGLLATSAERVMSGQLPHRDFVENYTGGLSCINALAFRAFGTSLFSMRIAIFCFFVAWVPAIFYLASRIASTVVAGAATLLAVAWGLPNFPIPMPSWYNLYLATFGAVALFRYVDTEERRWLFVAGLLGGASFLVKIIGLYYVAAVLLFLVFREELVHRSDASEKEAGASLYRTFVAGSLLLFLVFVIYLVRPPTSGRVNHLIIPAAAVVAVLLSRERFHSSATSTQRFASLLGTLLPFLAGVLIPIGIFLLPYLISGTSNEFIRGVFAAGIARTHDLAVIDSPPAICSIIAIPPLVALAIGYLCEPRFARITNVLTALIGALLLFVLGKYALTTQLVFESAQMLGPVVVVIGAAKLASRQNTLGAIREQQLMLLLSLSAICGLVQFPVPLAIYFCYYAPFLILTMLAIASDWPKPTNRRMLEIVVAFYILFAVVRMSPPACLLRGFGPGKPITPLSLPRGGGIRIDSPGMYEALVATVQQHSRNGRVLAFPECPEIYFLTGLSNPTRNDGGALSKDILQVVASKQVDVIVINQQPFFPSSKTAPEVLAAIEKAYPQSKVSDKFLIRWRM